MAQTKQKVFKRFTGHFLLTGVRPGLEQSGLSVQLENHKWEEHNHNQGRSPERSQSNCHDIVPGRSLTVRGPDCSLSQRSRTPGLGQRASQSVLEFWVDPMQRKRAQWNQPCGVLRFLIYSDGVEKKLFTQLWVQHWWHDIRKWRTAGALSKVLNWTEGCLHALHVCLMFLPRMFYKECAKAFWKSLLLTKIQAPDLEIALHSGHSLLWTCGSDALV